MPQIIQFNKFSKFHDGKKVFFCKTDFLPKDFEVIEKLNNEVILITGNSDFAVTENLVNSAPKNISKWFCQNNASTNPKTVTLPMGIENSIECKRSGHGVTWDFALEKNIILSSIFNKKIEGQTSNLIYSNFNINTNPEWRTKIKKMCLEADHITFEDSKLNYEQFISNILSHEAVVCPVGNCPQDQADTHRIYEVLYSNRIPIMFSYKQDHLYETLFKFLPVVFLEKPEQLFDKNYLLKHINLAKSKSKEKITLSYWERVIKESVKHV